jgi:hypothetical protein
MAEHEPSIGLSSDWLTPKPIFSGLELTFDLDPAHPGWENPYCVVPTRQIRLAERRDRGGTGSDRGATMKPATHTVTVRGAGIHGFCRWLKAGLRTHGVKVIDAYEHITAKVSHCRTAQR